MSKLGVSFDGTHTLRAWGLHWSDYSISAPTARTNIVDIPGAKVRLDLTEALYGKATYDNRTITMDFWIDTDRKGWMTLTSKIQNAIGGRRCKIVLDTDPDYYWQGRVTVDSTMSSDSPRLAFFTITADVEPYKYTESGGESL